MDGVWLRDLAGPEVMAIGLFEQLTIRDDVLLSSTVATTYKRIEKVRVSVLKIVKWRRSAEVRRSGPHENPARASPAAMSSLPRRRGSAEVR